MENMELFRIAQKIASMALEYVDKDHSLYDKRKRDIRPSDIQTESGLFLELSYGVPHSLWTPWGRWDCWGGGSGQWDSKVQALLERLGAIEYRSLEVDGFGEYGPVYAITRVNGVELPLAKERALNQYIGQAEARQIWHNLTHENK